MSVRDSAAPTRRESEGFACCLAYASGWCSNTRTDELVSKGTTTERDFPPIVGIVANSATCVTKSPPIGGE